MKTRAAVARQAGKILSLETVDIEGPKFGEVMVEIKATGICHTDESPAPTPKGFFPQSSAMKGLGLWLRLGPA
jgi:S-(hydroxymethyl)glutathione dehydrogenase/alcohol dehydrogenase